MKARPRSDRNDTERIKMNHAVLKALHKSKAPLNLLVKIYSLYVNKLHQLTGLLTREKNFHYSET